MHKARGISLTELLVTLGVAATVGGFALTSWTHAVAQSRSTSSINQLIGAVAATRNAAITRRTVATLCPSINGLVCGPRDSWHRGAIIFADRDRNGSRGANEAVIATLPGLSAGALAYWRSFRNRSSLSFAPTGLTLWQSGHFLLCPASMDARLYRQVIINHAGRARLARDRTGDGVAEDASGRPLSCP